MFRFEFYKNPFSKRHTLVRSYIKIFRVFFIFSPRLGWKSLHMTHTTGEKSLFKYEILIHEPFGVVLQKDSKIHNVTALSVLFVT
jgi:hypothetical protein